MSDKPSAAWYLAPIFLGIIGSAIMWYVLKDEDHPDSPKMVKKGWVIGIVLTVISFAWCYIRNALGEGAALRWWRNRTGRPLSPPQIHQKVI